MKPVRSANSLIVSDGGNGASHDWADWAEPRLVGPGGEIRLTGLKWHAATTGYGEIQIDRSVVEQPLRLGDRTYAAARAAGISEHALFQAREIGEILIDERISSAAESVEPVLDVGGIARF